MDDDHENKKLNFSMERKRILIKENNLLLKILSNEKSKKINFPYHKSGTR